MLFKKLTKLRVGSLYLLRYDERNLLSLMRVVKGRTKMRKSYLISCVKIYKGNLDEPLNDYWGVNKPEINPTFWKYVESEEEADKIVTLMSI